MTALWSYLLCATPRTGSTFLCSVLGSTGVAGRPESYFRKPDEQLRAARFGMPFTGDGSLDYRAFAAGASRAGRTDNGVFGARIMWETMHLVVDGLRADGTTETDVGILTKAFGPLRMVHLRRGDVVEQAVSWVRAEQTGYWQPGSVLAREPAFDLSQIDELVRTIEEHNAAWDSWFAEQGVRPLLVTYEDLAAAPARVVRDVFSHLGIEQPAGWQPHSSHRKQADGINADWIRRYRIAHQ